MCIRDRIDHVNDNKKNSRSRRGSIVSGRNSAIPLRSEDLALNRIPLLASVSIPQILPNDIVANGNVEELNVIGPLAQSMVIADRFLEVKQDFDREEDEIDIGAAPQRSPFTPTTGQPPSSVSRFIHHGRNSSEGTPATMVLPELNPEMQQKLDAITKEYMNLINEPPALEFPKRMSMNEQFYTKTKRLLRKKLVGSVHPEETVRERSEERNYEDSQCSSNEEDENHLVLFDNNIMVNKFNNRDEFLSEMDILKKKMAEMIKNIHDADVKEVMRILKESTTRNFQTRFSADVGTILCALVGAEMAERELMRTGNVKYLMVNQKT
eukprot:TRINITY_DN4639_c0_g1_i2.p1 TRINITY_DN4639_c0_g1~~TRINITY_DN4639_c0_g1_i2.p1  ORF type:complete len:343 (-),score=58.99 TRINITY_DN4639_c0_g1_i2:94-1065(-)